MNYRWALRLSLIPLFFATEIALATDEAVGDEAQRLFREGVRIVRRDRYEDALVRFERALAYRNRPNIVWNIACCHTMVGRRDLALAFFERYVDLVPSARSSLEVQQVLSAIAAEDQIIMNPARADDLVTQLTEAVDAAADGGATAAAPEQQVFGGGLESPDATRRAEVVRWRGTDLFQQGLQAVRVGDWDAALPLFERSMTYRSLRNAGYNVATIHLDSGRRDLALYFYRLYVASLPAVEADPGVAAVLRELEESPARVGDQTRRTDLENRISSEISRAFEASRSVGE
jgi:tetratricopeptide (TPR) repeat protein